MNEYQLESVYIELGSLCNLRCKHCYNSSGTNEFQFSKEVIFSLIKDIKEKNCNEITLSGGEPLLHKDIWEILKLSKQEKMNVTLITNGTTVTKNIAKKLSQYVQKVQVSLDGTTQEENDFIRGEGSFDKAMNAIQYLAEMDISTKVGFVLTENNSSQITNLVNKLSKLNVSNIDFKKMNVVGRANLNNFSGMSLKEYALKVNEVMRIQQEVGDISVYIQPLIFDEQCPLKYEENETPTYAPRISFTGEVFLCQMFDTKESFSVGNIKTQTLSEIFQSEKIWNFRKKISSVENIMNHCNSCIISDICCKECPAIILNNELDNYDDGLCEMRKNKLFENRQVVL